ncbi:Uncharacterised protein [Vibrio cholerae]|nr:Uncharacterised protein [Vibrio cholerae]
MVLIQIGSFTFSSNKYLTNASRGTVNAWRFQSH